MQTIMDRFADACTRFGLTISLDKTKVMHTPVPGSTYVEPDIYYVYGSRLDVVTTFVYLGSTISSDGSLDAEIKERISKASGAFGCLEDRVWSDRNITINTKLAVYETCVLSSLLYASESWTVYQKHIKPLERFHQHSLRHILGIGWESHTPDTVVLEKVSISMRVMKNQMRWAGHVVRMNDSRLPKQLFYGELSSGKRPPHKPRKRFQDNVKDNLKHMGLDTKEWENLALDSDQWRYSIHKGVEKFESDRVSRATHRRACRKREALPMDCGPTWICEVFGCVLLSKAGLVNHLKSHQYSRSQPAPASVPAPDQSTAAPAVHACTLCPKVCKSAGGLKRHHKVHGNTVPVPDPVAERSPLECHLCLKICKSRAGLLSHLRAHGRQEHTEEGMALV